MLSLLRCEWYQVRKALSVKIAFGIILIASLIFGMKFIDEAYFETLTLLNQQYLIYGGGSVCSSMQDAAGVLLIASLFAGWLIGAGFENRVIQEAISCGKSRIQIFCSKMVVYYGVVTLLSLVYWFGTAVPAFVKNGLGTAEVCGNLHQVSYIIGMVLAGIAAYISLFSLCGVVAFFTRRTGVTMGICFAALLFGGNLLASVLPEQMIKFLHYTPLGLYNLVSKLDVQWSDMLLTVGISLVWTLLICGLGYLKFRNTELK